MNNEQEKQWREDCAKVQLPEGYPNVTGEQLYTYYYLAARTRAQIEIDLCASARSKMSQDLFGRDQEIETLKLKLHDSDLNLDAAEKEIQRMINEKGAVVLYDQEAIKNNRKLDQEIAKLDEMLNESVTKANATSERLEQEIERLNSVIVNSNCNVRKAGLVKELKERDELIREAISVTKRYDDIGFTTQFEDDLNDWMKKARALIEEEK